MRVIFHGDDLGLTPGVNRGIINAFKHGLLTSTSLMAVGEAAEEAMAVALEHPGLDVGIHLVLADEPPLLAPEELSTLISKNGLLPTRNEILTAIFSRKLDYGQVEAEWCAQVEKVLKQGIRISHLDSHQFIHLFPGLFKVCRSISQRYNIPFIRSTIIEPSLFSAFITPGIGLSRLLQWFGLWGWTRLMAASGSFHSDATIPSVGFLHAGGRMDCAVVLGMLDKLTQKPWCSRVEFILHPGIGDNHTQNKYRHWHYTWENDLTVLLNDDLRKGLHMRNIKTTSFGKER
ncbi:MAG: ChbG/HpnK family deacetylase [Deltaproteobacteria bacterium]|nr:ChbG/HpnK family deacetylase [Deltaproteobacteria bacterium]